MGSKNYYINIPAFNLIIPTSQHSFRYIILISIDLLIFHIDLALKL